MSAGTKEHAAYAHLYIGPLETDGIITCWHTVMISQPPFSILFFFFFIYFTSSIKKLATTLGEYIFFHENHNDIKLPVYRAVNGYHLSWFRSI